MSFIKNVIVRAYFAGTPTVVKTNILIRSMGPVSELDMVGRHIFTIYILSVISEFYTAVILLIE